VGLQTRQQEGAVPRPVTPPRPLAQLFITAGTVRNHLKSIYGKLAIHSRLQAVERARALGLV
jgi:LuxR family maltose regulon positive regulatory protein